MTWKQEDAKYGVWSKCDQRFIARGYTREELEEELVSKYGKFQNTIVVYKDVTDEFHTNKCRFEQCRKEKPVLIGGCDALGCGVD